ncbi:MAG: hypothetical protein ABI595_06905 [Actinomycetota bacterium]
MARQEKALTARHGSWRARGRIIRASFLLPLVAGMSLILPATGAGAATDLVERTALSENVAALAAPGRPLTWGANPWGQLGDGTTTAHLDPRPVTGLTDVVKLDGGRDHAIALRAGGTVLTWGHNNLGQIGDGTSANRTIPTVVPGLANVTQVAAGHDHNLALLADGTVRAWGYNAFGQLGDGTVTNRRTPVTVTGLTGVVQIAGGRDMSFAIRSDGTLWAWGLNDSGQLGDGTTTNRTSPVRVGSLTGVTSVEGGRDHGLALLSNGEVWSWGDNTYGQLGDGTAVDRLTPVRVTSLSGVLAVGAGAHHSLALMGDGTVRSWGRNQLGQLGDGTTTTPRRTPVPVVGLTNVVAVGSGRDHGLAILADGTARAWGQNDFGQLGDGTNMNRRVPVVVNGLSSAVDVQGGRDYSVALVPAGPPDTTPPTQPGQPAGQSLTSSSIDLTWTAADDDVSASLTYRVFRDGVLVGMFNSASTTTVAFADTGLLPNSSHTYVVTAADAGGNIGPPSDTSDPISVLAGPSAIFTDDFSSGTLANWTTVTRFSIDVATGMPAPSARAAVSNQTATLAKTLSGSFPNLCVSWRINVSARTGSIALLRLRTGAAGPVARVLVNSSGVLALRSDVSGITLASGVQLGTGWHSLEVCGTVGTSGTWDLYRDGTRIVTAWPANTGTTPMGSFELGNPNAGTWTANVDDVRVDQTPG